MAHRHRSKKVSPKRGRWTMGIHSVREAIKVRPKAVSLVQVRSDYLSNPELRLLVESLPKHIRLEKIPLQQIDKLGQSQGIAAEVGESPGLDLEILGQEGVRRILILDGIQDPHNLGALIRSSWLLGVSAIFISEHRSSPLTPTAAKVASGGVEHVPVMTETSLPNLLSTLKEAGFWIFGLEALAPGTIWEQKFPEKVALVVGSEEKGLRVPVQRACDELIRIPQTDSEASFNASVAGALALAEVLRQQTQLPKNS